MTRVNQIVITASDDIVKLSFHSSKKIRLDTECKLSAICINVKPYVSEKKKRNIRMLSATI